ncbi:IS3 family transposase [Sebaldella termitidis]
MRGLLFEYIESWYNNERIQKILGDLSPTEYLSKFS